MATRYLAPTAPGVEIASILTAGDTVAHFNGGTQLYRMSGVPDGLGAFDNDRDDDDDFAGDRDHARCHRDEGTFTVVMNHEFGGTEGVDQIQHVRLWNAATSSYYDTTGVNFNRFCSADLARPRPGPHRHGPL